MGDELDASKMRVSLLEDFEIRHEFRFAPDTLLIFAAIHSFYPTQVCQCGVYAKLTAQLDTLSVYLGLILAFLDINNLWFRL
jgi:hypothetical protein